MNCFSDFIKNDNSFSWLPKADKQKDQLINNNEKKQMIQFECRKPKLQIWEYAINSNTVLKNKWNYMDNLQYEEEDLNV